MPLWNHPLDFWEVNMQARLVVMQGETLRKAFGARLKTLRKQRHWAQKELREGLIDELLIYMAPMLMGDSARGLFHLPGLDTMAEGIALEIRDVRAVGDDWRITARVRETVAMPHQGDRGG